MRIFTVKDGCRITKISYILSIDEDSTSHINDEYIPRYIEKEYGNDVPGSIGHGQEYDIKSGEFIIELGTVNKETIEDVLLNKIKKSKMRKDVYKLAKDELLDEHVARDYFAYIHVDERGNTKYINESYFFMVTNKHMLEISSDEEIDEMIESIKRNEEEVDRW